MFFLVLKNAVAKTWQKMLIVAVLFGLFTYFRNGAIEWSRYVVACGIAFLVVLMINAVREYRALKR